MFVTLEDFFNNYRIKNQQQPNETVLNRGLMRLKRETRELKSILDILLNGDFDTWDSNRVYEKDEYVKYNDLIYKSRIYTNYNHTPFREDSTNWEIITLESLGTEGKGKFLSKEFTATEGQTVFVLPFNMDGTPMVYVEGILLDSDKYIKTDNITITLSMPANAGEKVIISSGVTYETSLVLPRQSFTSTGQTNFECSFNLKSPSVFIDGILQNESTYTWANQTLIMNSSVSSGKIVVVANGNILGDEIYNIPQIDDLLDLKRNISDSYSISEIDALIDDKSSITYVDGLIDGLETVKADKSTTLNGYGIDDAYTKTEIDDQLNLKLDLSEYSDENILTKIKSIDGIGSGLDADLIQGLTPDKFIRSDVFDEKQGNLELYKIFDVDKRNTIVFDIEDLVYPGIYVTSYKPASDSYVTNEVYTDGNTGHVMVVKEGYFKGQWEPTLNGTFGITEYYLYNWVVTVTPTLIGYEHDYNKDFGNGHTPFTGFDNTLTWNENQSEYHYGYIEGNVVKLESIHRNGTSRIDIPARYHLIGILKTFSSYEQINQI